MLKFRVGDIEVQRVVELVEPFQRVDEFFPEASAEALDPHRHWLEPDALCPESQRIILPVQSYLIRTRHHTILIDTCIGCRKSLGAYPQWHNRQSATWLEKLVGAGVSPKEIDFVFCTHLHLDHCGWNTRLIEGRWEPSFPNAKYVLARVEVEESQAEDTPVFRESVLPVLEASQAVLVETDYALDDNIWLEPTPGHTPGHVAINLASRGQRATMGGDIVISPIQCAYPQWCSRSDANKPLAVATRRRFLEARAESDELVLTAHFPEPSVGRITASRDTFRFQAMK